MTPEADLAPIFWIDRLPDPAPSLASSVLADIAVIGGGYTGLSAAYFLKSAHPHKKVLVLEARVSGAGASSRNAGMALTGLGADLDSLERQLGTERARRTVAILIRGLDLVEELSRRHGYEIGFERTGSLSLARTERQARFHRTLLDVHRRLGVEAEILDRPAVRNEIGSPLYVSGFHKPAGTAMVNPWQVVRGLRRAALSAGVVVHERTPVLEVHEGEVHRLVCPGGEVRAPHLVLATNGYSPHLGYFKNRVAPVHVSMALTEPLEPALRRSLGWARRQSLWEEGWLYHFFRLAPDDRVLIGGGWAVYRMGDDLRFPHPEPVYRRLERALVRIFPQLRGVRFTHHWNGPVGFSRDFLPSIGVTGRRRNIFYSLGYTGNGVSLSHLAGQIIRDLYAGERTELTDLFLVNRPFKSLLFEPFKWLVINAVRNGYLVLDRLGI
jgi:gamma-glutamylputrescine oxidase